MNTVSIVGFILLSVLCIGLFVLLVIKYRNEVTRFFRKKQMLRFIANIFVPFAVPMAFSVLAIIFNEDHTPTELAWAIVLSIVASVNLAVQFGIWFKEKNEADLRWANRAAGYAYNNLFEIHMDKNTQLRNSYHNGLDRGMLTDADIPYNIFNHIRKITWEFGNTIGQITGIHSKDIETAFIYRYTYEGVSKKR